MRGAEPQSLGGRALRAAALVAVASALVLGGVPLCPFSYVSGVPCPGCGLTRAGLCLLRGDVAGAIALSPLSPLVVPLTGMLVGRALWLYVRGRAQVPPRWLPLGAIVLWALLVGVWALRFAGLFGGPVPVTSVWG